jgi:SAM-dependent methyltransferase
MAEWSTQKAESASRLLELIMVRLISESLHVAAALGVADLLADGPKSSEQLAEATGASAPYLHRVLRALTTFNVFSQDAAGRFALAPMGEFLRRDVEGSLNGTALFFGGERGASIEALFLESVKTGESASEKLFSGDWISRIQSDPEGVKIFNAMMTTFSTIHLTGVLEAYDFSEIGKIVDVGGGHGKIIAEILKRNPRMRGILFDMQHAFAGGRKTIEQAGLADRCEIVSGNFFVSVPAGADAYLLSRVIHDWNDEKSVAILKVIRRAMAPNGRVLILETMLRPTPRPVYPVLSDLNMLLRTGGCERTEDDYRALYRGAGYELTRAVATISPTGTTVIEGRPV